MKKDNNTIFWEISKEYVNHHLPNIRKASEHTCDSYRTGLNKFIDYLETERGIPRQKITFYDFTRDNIKDYFDWLLNTKKLSKKTCNLRLTAIHSLLEYASNENDDFISVYLKAKTVKGIKLDYNTIEYFEDDQMKELLIAHDLTTRTGRRNQMILILMYDSAARVSEIRALTVEDLHLNASVPYITIYGKGRKYRNIPLMEKTVKHLKRYLGEFHSDTIPDTPLFYSRAHGAIQSLSPDTLENLIKESSKKVAEKGIEMPARPHCHMIRKTRAMSLYNSGVPLTHVQQLLGHENISTTSGFYAFATLETLAKTLKKADDANAEKSWKNPEVLNKLLRL